MQKYKIIVILLIAIAFGGTFAAHKSRAPKRNYSDFSCFYKAGQRMLHKENIYVLRDKEAAEFRYAPVFAMLMSGLALTDIATADTIWFIINFLLLIAIFAIIKRLIIPQLTGLKKIALIYGLSIAGVARLSLHNFDLGQSNIIMLASVIFGLYLFAQGKEFPGALVFAFSIMIKYTPLIFLPYFLFRKQWKRAAFLLLSILIYLLLPALVVGIKANYLYLNSLFPFLTQSTIFDFFTVLDPKNQSLLACVHRLFTNCILYFYAPIMPFQYLSFGIFIKNIISLCCAAILYTAVFILPKPKLGLEREHIDHALLLICVVLFNLNSWEANFIFLSLPYFIISAYLTLNKFKDRFVVVLLGISYVLNTLVTRAVLGKEFAYKIYFYSPLTFSAIIAFVLLLGIRRRTTGARTERV